jgi:hypothetical protein
LGDLLNIIVDDRNQGVGKAFAICGRKRVNIPDIVVGGGTILRKSGLNCNYLSELLGR